jgi:hypothetical protein
MSGRVLVAVAGAAVALLAGAPAANAAQLFAVPTGGSNVGDCTNIGMNPPCTLTRAVEEVAANADEVIVNPGTYDEGQIEIDAAIFLHGVAGQARPEIVGPQAGLRVIDPGASGSSVSYLRLTGPQGIRIGTNATVDQVIAKGSTSSGCTATPGNTSSINIYNSVCIGTEGDRGVEFQAIGIADTLVLRNVTAFAPGAGYGIFVFALDSFTSLTVEARNVVADSSTDVGTQGSGEVNGDLSFSNYDTVSEQATTSTVTDPTTMNNQMTPPVFADADLHQAASSPTVNAGSDGLILGLPTEILDVDGDMRIVGTSVDIGADEFVPAAPVSPTVPAATGQRAAALSKCKKKKRKKARKKCRKRANRLPV